MVKRRERRTAAGNARRHLSDDFDRQLRTTAEELTEKGLARLRRECRRFGLDPQSNSDFETYAQRCIAGDVKLPLTTAAALQSDFIRAAAEEDGMENLFVCLWRDQLNAKAERTPAEDLRLAWLDRLLIVNDGMSNAERMAQLPVLPFDEVIEQGTVRLVRPLYQFTVARIEELEEIAPRSRTTAQQAELDWRLDLVATAMAQKEKWGLYTDPEDDEFLRELGLYLLGVDAQQLEEFHRVEHIPKERRTRAEQALVDRVISALPERPKPGPTNE